MIRFLIRRLLILPIALLVINFVAFSYAHLAQRVQQAQNPFGSNVDVSVTLGQLYAGYMTGMLHGDFGTMPLVGAQAETVAAVVGRAAGASILLLLLAGVLSMSLGLILGVGAVRAAPLATGRWLPIFSSLGLAAPGFLMGALGIAALLALSQRFGVQNLLPLQGFGIDGHLLLPLFALTLRPTLLIAQSAAGLLMEELGKQHITAARGRGAPLRTIRWKHALRNALPPLLLVMAGAFRLVVGEMIVVEWLFSWPGLGRLLAGALIPPNVAAISGLSGEQRVFLHPELVAAILSGLGLLFLLVDLLSALAVQVADPRLRVTAEEPERG